MGRLEVAGKVKFMNTLNLGQVTLDDYGKFKEAQEALKELIEFRNSNEHLYIADFINASAREYRRIDIELLLSDISEEELVEKCRLNAEKLGKQEWGQWAFCKDKENIGMKEGWHLQIPKNIKEWKDIDVPHEWKNTLIGEYKGYGWYRTNFKLKEAHKGQPLNFLFESIAEEAWVYINGKFVGEHIVEKQFISPDMMCQHTFIIEVGRDELKRDEENVIVIRVYSSGSNGGICGPISVYAPDNLD